MQGIKPLTQLFLKFSKSVQPSSRKTRATEPLEIIALKKSRHISQQKK
jgi:hypothetical protein